MVLMFSLSSPCFCLGGGEGGKVVGQCRSYIYSTAKVEIVAIMNFWNTCFVNRMSKLSLKRRLKVIDNSNGVKDFS